MCLFPFPIDLGIARTLDVVSVALLEDLHPVPPSVRLEGNFSPLVHNWPTLTVTTGLQFS